MDEPRISWRESTRPAECAQMRLIVNVDPRYPSVSRDRDGPLDQRPANATPAEVIRGRWSGHETAYSRSSSALVTLGFVRYSISIPAPQIQTQSMAPRA